MLSPTLAGDGWRIFHRFKDQGLVRLTPAAWRWQQNRLGSKVNGSRNFVEALFERRGGHISIEIWWLGLRACAASFNEGGFMTQRQFEREVACATGESVNTIRRRGFSLVEPEYPEPLVVDWEELDAQQVGVFPARVAAKRAA
jgi:hypothetical protein